MRSLGLRVRAWIGLVTFVGSLALPMASPRHLTFDDDAACVAPELTGTHPGMQVGAAVPATPTGHCPLCHWLRAVGGAKTGAVVAAIAWLEPTALQAAPPAPRHTITLVVDRPSRAPPSSLG